MAKLLVASAVLVFGATAAHDRTVFRRPPWQISSTHSCLSWDLRLN